MLLIDTIDVGTEDAHVFKTVMTAGDIIKCFLLGVPCVLRTEIVGDDDSKITTVSPILAINHGGAASSISTVLVNELFVATVTDPEEPAVFEAN